MTESFIESASVAQNIIYQETGRMVNAETLSNWGIRGGETGEQLRLLANEYKDHLQS